MRTTLLASICALCLAGLAVAQPAISTDGVLNGGSYTNKIAQGSIFVVKGTGLCPPGYEKVNAYPVPKTLNGVNINFTPVAGGAAVAAYMVYTYNIGGVVQLAGLLPSDTAPGDYNVTVGFGGATSGAQKVSVVERSFGIVSADSSGSGPAQATNGAVNKLIRFTTGTLAPFALGPAHPGEVIILWGTGIGPDLQSDSTGASKGNQTAAGNVTVIVGDKSITPAYAGRAPGLAGTDQINVALPADVQLGCFVPVSVRTGSTSSSTVTIAIAGAGKPSCESQTLTESQLKRLADGGTLTWGAFDLSSFSTAISFAGLSGKIKSDSIGGAFAKYTAGNIGDATANFTTIGACTVVRRIGKTGDIVVGTLPSKNLDAGKITLTGPNVTDLEVTKEPSSNSYNTTLASATEISGLPGGIPGLPGGTNNFPIQAGPYSLKGAGGADVGPFNVSITVPTLLDWTNRDSITQVVRASGVGLTWTGGAPNDYVYITGYSGNCVSGCGDIQNADKAVYDTALFVCTAKASDGGFNVPSAVTLQLPASTGTLGGSIGALSLFSGSPENVGKFNAALTPAAGGGNIDFGIFTYSVGSLTTVPYI